MQNVLVEIGMAVGTDTMAKDTDMADTDLVDTVDTTGDTLTDKDTDTDTDADTTLISLINVTSRLPILKNSTLHKTKTHPTRLLIS